MALEKMCGFNNLPFRRGDLNIEFADMEMQMAKATSNNPYNLMAPPFDNPEMNLNKILAQKNIKLNLAHGTTTLGFKYRGGIVMCADSQTSTNDFIATQRSKKIMELDNCMLGTIAGCAGDCVHWQRVLASECRLYRLQNENRSMSITSASKFIHNIVHRFAGMGLNMGLILAGYDEPHPDGAKLIYISDEGDRVEGNLFSIGSGSNYALGVLDAGYNWNMSNEEAFYLARRAVYNATNCDPYSGGFIYLYHMTENGWQVISIENCQRMQPEFAVPMDIEDDDDSMLVE